MILVLRNYQTKQEETITDSDALRAYWGLRTLNATGAIAVADLQIVIRDATPPFHNALKVLAVLPHHPTQRAIQKTFKPQRDEHEYPATITIRVPEGSHEYKFIGWRAPIARRIAESPCGAMMAGFFKSQKEDSPVRALTPRYMAHVVATMGTGMKLLPMENVARDAIAAGPEAMQADPAVQIIAQAGTVFKENATRSYVECLNLAYSQIEEDREWAGSGGVQ